MSFEKFRSWQDKKDKGHYESHREEIEYSLGKSPRELGIYNEQEVLDRLRGLHERLNELDELDFIKELTFQGEDANVYLVGGSVRDGVLDKKSKDIDLMVNKTDTARLINILSKFGKITFDKDPNVNLDNLSDKEKQEWIESSYGVIKFNPENNTLGEPIDISFPREENYSDSSKARIKGIKRDVETRADPDLNIQEDLKRRDFTINAMALNLTNGEIVDPFDGITDLVKGEIKAVGDPKERILEEDFSRAFRAIRFACTFNGNIETKTKQAVKQVFEPVERSLEEMYEEDQEKLKQLQAYEKEVRQDLKKETGNLPRCFQVYWDKQQQKPRMAVPRETLKKEIITSIEANPSRLINLLDEIKALNIIFPELEDLKGVSQPKEHHMEGDVFKHTKKLLENLPKDASLRLKLAGLFHDIGKPETRAEDEKGKITFHGHDKKSSEHWREIAKRLRLKTKIIEEADFLIKNHMIPLHGAKNMKAGKLYDKFLSNEALGEDLLALAKADALASLPEKGEPNIDFVEDISKRLQELKKKSNRKQQPSSPKLINGRDLLELGFEEGPEIGKTLTELWEMQLNGEITSRDQAREIAEQLKRKG